ncbi:GAF domain-like protein [Durotheca rogersii]|uniref:GAF domain-like protein n=1 Tax=Durotheca rogersii TaxID=419775 RepID=UPI002220ECCA|nr:GAF domain-like protein [Durotheca rogersii]KAI5860121.1 GAF domain-like protein [Durotheca rogersii]
MVSHRQTVTPALPRTLPSRSNSSVCQVHADASNFADGITKEQAYEQVLLQAEGLFDGQRNWVCNLANTAALLWHAYKSLPAPSSRVNWAGFYVLDPAAPASEPRLVLGPFQGKVACQTIAFGRGVCGAAAAARATQLVADVDQFPGHIACDGDSRSEIVVPVVVVAGAAAKLVAIIDVDCADLAGFDDVDKAYLERLADLLARSCDW